MNECCSGILSDETTKEIERLVGIVEGQSKLVYVLAFDSNDNISTLITNAVTNIERFTFPSHETQITSIQSASFGTFTGSRCHWRDIGGETIKITHNH